MKARVTGITGFDDAFTSMFISKRTWTPELGEEIVRVCDSVLDKHGRILPGAGGDENGDIKQFNKWLDMLLRMGRRHITVLRFIDISIMTEGLHRAGQDDVDAHARRFDNRIIRNSTRLATFGDDEMSEWYRDKIMTTDRALKELGIDIPEKFVLAGETYVKSPNGYIKEEYADNKDVKRGLYMLSIPSNFLSKINLCEWSHVFKERNKDGGANPEVKEWAEMVTEQIASYHGMIDRDYILSVQN